MLRGKITDFRRFEIWRRIRPFSALEDKGGTLLRKVGNQSS